jgi:hypothetical protein
MALTVIMIGLQLMGYRMGLRIGGLDSFLAILSAFLRFRPVMTVYERQSSGHEKI